MSARAETMDAGEATHVMRGRKPRRSPRVRIPFVAQMERSECGAACLAMVLGAFGRFVSLADLRRDCGISRDGASAAVLAGVAKHHGLEVSAMRVGARGLSALATPAILYWEGAHFVVLERLCRDGSAIVVDPERGRRRCAPAELATAFSGIALTFSPGASFARIARQRPGMGLRLAALRGHAGGAALVVGAALLLEVLGLLFPATTQVIVDHVIAPHRERWLVPIALGLAMAIVARTTLTLLRDRLVHALHMALDLTLMPAFTSHLLRLPALFFDQRATGDLMARVAANAQLREITTAAAMALLDGFLALGYTGMMLVYDPLLGSLIVGITVARLLLVSALRRGADQAAATALALRGRELGVVVEAVSSPETVKAFQIEESLLARFESRLIDRLNAGLERGRILQRLGPALAVFDGPAQAAVLWLGGQAVMRNEMTLGVFAGFLTLSGLLRGPLEAFVGFWQQMNLAQGTLARIDDVLEMTPEASGSADPGRLDGSLALEEVSFRYGAHGAQAFAIGILLQVEAGQTVAIVGPSGAGKSTLLRLMLGFVTPSAGRVTLGGRDLRDLDLGRVRRQLGVVLQEPFLFNDTVRANLCLDEADPPLERLRRACWLACFDDVVARLPAGLDTVVGDNGASLSGGQRQRLSLARALVGRPRILLLDEATSSLDPETEEEISRRLATIRCTRIIIAHRLATVRRADRIFVLDRGRIVQQGTFASLLEEVGLFRQMVHSLETR